MRVRGEHAGFVIRYRLHVRMHVRSTSCVLIVKQAERHRSRQVQLTTKLPILVFKRLDAKSGLPCLHVHALPLVGERAAVHVLPPLLLQPSVLLRSVCPEPPVFSS